jgi:hypothetical protein
MHSRGTKSSSKVALCGALNHIMSAKLPPMPLWKHAIAYVTLGLLCGWYYFIMMLYPVLLILAVRGSYIAGGVLLGFIILSLVPLKYKVRNGCDCLPGLLIGVATGAGDSLPAGPGQAAGRRRRTGRRRYCAAYSLRVVLRYCRSCVRFYPTRSMPIRWYAQYIPSSCFVCALYV